MDITKNLVLMPLWVLLIAFWRSEANIWLEGRWYAEIPAVEGIIDGIYGVFEVGFIEMFDLWLIGKDEHL